ALMAGSETIAGNLLAAWNFSREGLAVYRSGPHSGIRAHQIYLNLYRSAGNLGLTQTAFVLSRAAAEAIAETPRQLTEATTWADNARLAVAAGWLDDGKVAFERAVLLFDSLPQTPGSQEFRFAAELDRAQAEATGGNSAAALQRLERFRPQTPVVE